jgi:hypothetical protein
MASGTPWGYRGAPTESHGPTTVADRRHDLDRRAIGGRLAPLADEQSATRGRTGRLPNDPCEHRNRTDEASRNLDVAELFGLAGGLLWSRSVGQLARRSKRQRS